MFILVIKPVASYKDGHRVVDKYHSCLFCGKLQLRIARHIQVVHKTEKRVEEIIVKTGKEKKMELDKLRLQGDYAHNLKVLEGKASVFIVGRRPSQSTSTKVLNIDEYLPCVYCKGFYLNKELWRHQKGCRFNTDLPSGKKTLVQQNSTIMLQSTLERKIKVNEDFANNILPSLISDNISRVIKNDNLILRLGESLYMKHGVCQKKYITQELILLGRITLVLREICGNRNGYLEDFLKPINFDNIIQAAQQLAGIKKDNTLQTPSIGLKCGPLLKKCSIILKGDGLRTSNEKKEKDAERLQKLIEEEWKHKITSLALKSIKQIKRNTQVLLPTMPDLIKLKNHLEDEIKMSKLSLDQEPNDVKSFQRLSSAILCRLIMFNRRRSGEASKILVKDFVERPNWQSNLNEEMLKSLPALEQQLVNRYDFFGTIILF
jgi:hypothetical protein